MNWDEKSNPRPQFWAEAPRGTGRGAGGVGARAGLSDKGNTPAVGEVDGALLRADRGGGSGAERFARGSAMLQRGAEGGHFGFHLPREPAADQVG